MKMMASTSSGNARMAERMPLVGTASHRGATLVAAMNPSGKENKAPITVPIQAM